MYDDHTVKYFRAKVVLRVAGIGKRPYSVKSGKVLYKYEDYRLLSRLCKVFRCRVLYQHVCNAEEFYKVNLLHYATVLANISHTRRVPIPAALVQQYT